MKLGLQLGYWSAQPPENHAELVAAAEKANFDTVFTAEAWGSDAFTPLAWWGRETSRLRLGTQGAKDNTEKIMLAQQNNKNAKPTRLRLYKIM